MKSINALLLPLLFSCLTIYSQAQNIGGIVNIYTPVTDISGCSKHILAVGSAQGFSPGDKVLIIQMQGAMVDLTNSPSFGDLVGTNNAGVYEFNRVENVQGNQIQLQFKTLGQYDVAGRVQLVRVPEYMNATVTNVLTCQPWNGTTGGVLVIDVAGTLTLQDDIDVSQKGFRGGQVVDANAAPYGELGYFYAPNPIVSGQKGEGIAIIPLDHSYGRGKAANGGGAGNSHNGGGGGGGNAGEGGFGGLEYYNTPGSPTSGTNGIGGLKAFWDSSSRLLMGGGGGAGHTNDEHGTSGGTGGGIAILKANTIIGNFFNVLANGETVIADGTERNDGQGGGGAGGTVFIQTSQLNGNLNCDLNGGDGGNCLFFVQSQIIGPGGGGGGGKLLLSQNLPGLTWNLAGGQNGIANQNLSNGATDGLNGVKLDGVNLINGAAPAVVEINETIALCPNDTIVINGQNYIAPFMVNLTLPGSNGDCDTLATYELILKNQISINETIPLCPGETTTLGGQTYTAPATVNLMLAGSNGDCDTLATYTLELKNQLSITQVIALCPGETTTLGGQAYTAPATVNLTLAGSNGDCDTLATYVLVLKNQVSINETIALCPGETTTLGGQTYSAPATVNLTFTGSNGDCDTLATYILELKNQLSITQVIALCPGETTTLGGQSYAAPATVNLTLAGSNGDCDTLATYVLVLKNQVSINETIALCPGETTILGGQTYTAPATVNLTFAGSNGECDTLATYTLELLTQPTFSQTIEFCPGETVLLGGTSYTQPGVVTLSLPATSGCDTIATYTLEYLTPAPSNVGIVCPENISVITSPGAGPFAVTYADPTAASDCPCPGLELVLTSGLPSGSLFPVTSTPVCWQASDSCGQTASCCFVVTVREEAPCDVKTNGCMKYELLNITADAAENRTYRIRVTNSCANKMTYTAIQIPDGMTAMSPAENSIYTAEVSGREYLVRNPNFSPFYSVRFKSIVDSISGGQSEIFRYKLPAQADPTYIHILSRLEPQVYYEAHLNTFNCPIGITPPDGNRPTVEREMKPLLSPEIRLFPNPTSGTLFADLSDWEGQDVQLRVLDSRGQMVLQRAALANALVQSIDLPESLSSGLYFLEVWTALGGSYTARFALAR